jgi:hypothetical protein
MSESSTRTPSLNSLPASQQVPLHAPVCPQCGQANVCAVSAAGRFDVPCWCTEVTLTADGLHRLASLDRNRGCLCRRCLEALSGSAAAA